MELELDLPKLQRMPPSAFARKAKIKNAQAKVILNDLKGFSTLTTEQLIEVLCRHLEAD